MRIEITNGYVVTTDGLNYVLNKAGIIQKGPNEGDACLEAIGFFPTLGMLADSLINRMVRQSVVEQLHELDAQIKQITKDFESAILIQDGKESPAHA